VFYVVINDAAGVVKFGITSGDPRPRLYDHRVVGYERTLFLASGVNAKSIEDDVKAALAERGYKPVQRVEYFSLDALPAIMETVGWHEISNEAVA
jgi:hypothetical protein